jgi:hypothetical protein
MYGLCGKVGVWSFADAFISSHERKKKTILVLAVKAYVQCRGVVPVILDLGTKCR